MTLAAPRSSGTGPLRSVDFERALSRRPTVRSEHFVLHHVPALRAAPGTELSTADARVGDQPVEQTLCARRFGLVVPKRHARRAVTRSLIKRQGRTAIQRHAGRIGAGDWVLRLRSPFPKDRFPSAASDALRAVVRAELDTLFADASARSQ